MSETLNERAERAMEPMRRNAEAMRIAWHNVNGASVVDCGVEAAGGLEAGLVMARVCLAGLGNVCLAPSDDAGLGMPIVHVASDQPVLACMASQYAGWQISVGKYFAMGSGPMRAHYGKEKLLDEIPGRETAPLAVGVLETGKLPTAEVIDWLSQKLQLPGERITLLAARTASLAGGVQVVARSLEMALHKLHELKFDLRQIVSGMASAPLPPPGKDDLTSIGRTNDAILYGGRAIVYVRADDAVLRDVGPKVPSSASPEHGALFGELFAKHKDFYKIDPLLFSPAEIVFCNLTSGRVHRFGQRSPEILERSFSN